MLTGAVLRLAGLGAHLPGLASGDEQVMVGRSLALARGRLPVEYDWPSGAFVLVAPLLRPGPDTGASPYLVALAVVAVAGIALVAVTALLAAALVPPGRRRRVAAWLAAAAAALAYPAVSASRTAHPEMLQDAAATAALLVTLRLATDPRRRWAVLAGALGGAAAGLKYVGGVVVLVTVVAALLPAISGTTAAPAPGPGSARRSARVRWDNAGATVAAAALAFLALVPGLVTDPGRVGAGIVLQFAHSASGHVGFDSATPAALYHVRETLPGALGLPVAVLIGAGMLDAVWRGGRRARLVVLFVLLAAIPIGWSHLTFPRYALLVLPALFCLAAAAASRVVRGPRSGAALLGVALVVLTPPALDAARLVRAQSAPDTRELATEVVSRLPAPVYAENFTVELGATARGAPVTPIVGLDRRPDLGPGCGCYVLVSSFMQDRYRAEPDRYRAQLDRYAQLATTATLIDVFAPTVPLQYRWEALPQYGVHAVPLSGPLTGGPTVSVYHWN